MRVMKTFRPSDKDIDRKWWIADADGQTLGRFAVKVTGLLYGKDKPCFSRDVDTGDFVVVVNAAKIRVTGKKAVQKEYFRYSGYPRGAKYVSYREMHENHPDRIISHAVSGMLPKNLLRAKILKRLKVYAGPEHVHSAQKPEPVK